MRRITALLVATVVLSACGSDHAATAGAKGSITVFAAASLTEAFDDEKATLANEQPGLSITYNFAGSGTLATQVEQGAPADVIATADTTTMQRLVDAGLVETPTTFARNELEILVAPGNPKGINGLADLGRSDLTFVTEDDTVPAGKYAAQALAAAGVTVHPASKETDVKSAVAKVTSGEADATIVYVTDVDAAGPKATGVEIPTAQNVVAEYPIAVVKGGNHDAAVAFIDAIVHGSGRAALTARGFEPAPS